jgi:hypothetical protein
LLRELALLFGQFPPPGLQGIRRIVAVPWHGMRLTEKSMRVAWKVRTTAKLPA